MSGNKGDPEEGEVPRLAERELTLPQGWDGFKGTVAKGKVSVPGAGNLVISLSLSVTICREGYCAPCQPLLRSTQDSSFKYGHNLYMRNQ